MGSNWKALIAFVIHFYSKLYPNSVASLFGLIQTSIVYLPYALAAMDILMDGPFGGIMAVSGLIVSQALYMLEWHSTSGESTPKRNSWLAAPTWFKNLFGKQIANPDAADAARRVYGQASAPAGRGFSDGGRGANTATTSGYNWGSGHRLGDS
jgi:Derlin-2/3